MTGKITLALIEKIKILSGEVKLKKVNQIIACLLTEQHGRALLLACKNCKCGDKGMLRLVKLICSYKTKISFDIDYKEKGMTAIGYAAMSGYIELFLTLKNLDAKLTAPLNKGIVATECYNNQLKASQQLQNIYRPEFLATYLELNEQYTKLPSRNENDNETQKHDLNRIEFIINVLEFIDKYQQPSMRLTKIPANLSPILRHRIDFEQMDKSRMLLEKVCITISNFSISFYKKYKHSFTLSPFNWMVFDQFGAVLRNSPQEQRRYIPVGSGVSEGREEATLDLYEKITWELLDRQDIIEEAVLGFIKVDLKILKHFFYEVATNIKQCSEKLIKPIALIHVKAITSYIFDLDNLIKLLNLVFYIRKNILSNQKFTQGQVILSYDITSEAKYNTLFDLNTLKGKHAALHHLVKLGELVTGKNFSAYLCNLDNTIDWQALIDIRDGIVHQDAGDNLFQIQKLISKVEWFEAILNQDMLELAQRLSSLIILRDKKLGSYNFDTNKFWLQILALETLNQEKTKIAIPKIVPQTDLSQISEEEQKIFIEALREEKAPPDIILSAENILKGKSKIPGKKELGMIKSYLPKRAVDKQRHKILSEIMDKATKKPTTTVDERNQKREQEKKEYEARELQRLQQLTGLDNLRKFANTLHKSANQDDHLSPRKRVIAARDALGYLLQFLVNEGYIRSDLNFTTMEQWDNFHIKNLGLPLVKRLELNVVLNDALEYNAAQFLQHLNTICNYNAAKKCNKILASYSELRGFRNYIEHGNPLYDYQKADINNPFEQTDHRQKFTAPMFIKLIYEILPEFELIVKEFTDDYVPHMTPLVTEQENTQWSVACNRKYNINAFFNPCEKENKEGYECVEEAHDNTLEGECHYC
mgnify:CR=1 FL=1